MYQTLGEARGTQSQKNKSDLSPYSLVEKIYNIYIATQINV